MTAVAPARPGVVRTERPDLPAPRRTLRDRLARPLVASLVLLLGYFAMSLANDPRGYLGTDTGGKVAALRAMVDGGSLDSDIGYWAERFDPDGEMHPLALTRHLEDRWLSVTTLPMLYAAAPLYEVGGLRAIVLLPMVGAVLTALGARALARRLEEQRGRPDRAEGSGTVAFWTIGLVTPVVVYALDFWEHTLGLAAMLWAVVLLFDVCRDRSGAGRTIVAGALFGIAATMRTEALVYATAAILVAAAALWLRRRSLGAVTRFGTFVSAGAIVPLVANLGLEHLVLGTPFRAARTSGAALSPGDGGGSRVRDALTTSVGLNQFQPALDWGLGVFTAMMLVITTCLLVSPDAERRRLARYPFLAAVFVYVLLLGGGLGFVPGMLTASPLAAVGLALILRDRPSRFPACVALLALPVVWFFQYSGGAGPQWGGRYVLLSGTLLAVIAATSLRSLPASGRAAIVGLALVVTVTGVAWLSVRSHGVADAMEVITRWRGPVVSAEYPHLFREGGAFYTPARRWLTAETTADEPRAARVLEQAGFDRFTRVGVRRGEPHVGSFRRVGSERLAYLPGSDLVVTRYEHG